MDRGLLPRRRQEKAEPGQVRVPKSRAGAGLQGQLYWGKSPGLTPLLPLPSRNKTISRELDSSVFHPCPSLNTYAEFF